MKILILWEHYPLYLDYFYSKHPRLMNKLNFIEIRNKLLDDHYCWDGDLFLEMKNDSIVINISRGSLINEKDLLHALDNKLIAGAALDVFANEPLNKKSPFWNYDNVIIYPHSASTTYKENERITNIFSKNIKLFLKGKPLINQFNSEKGY